MSQKFVSFFKEKIINRPRVVYLILMLGAITVALQAYLLGSYGNYKIFTHSFSHLVSHQSLYEAYPLEYWDLYLYGPSFAALMGIFHFFPDGMGLVLWNVMCMAFVIHSVYLLRLSPPQKSLILLLSATEMMAGMGHIQTNPILLSLIIYSFVFFERNQIFWAATVLLLGFHIKVFALAAGAFIFLYPAQLPKFFLFSFIWAIIIGAIPLIFIPLKELIWQYQEWIKLLVEDLDIQKETSFTGLINVFFGQHHLRNALAQIIAALITCISFFRLKNNTHYPIQLVCLSSILIWVVIFNHAAESASYLIATVGIALWVVIQPQKFHKIEIIILSITLIFSILSPMDIFPRYLREQIIEPYSLKALGPSLLWFYIVWEMWQSPSKYAPTIE